MVVLGVVLGVLLATAAGILVAAVSATLLGGGAGLGLAGAALLCVGVPALLERKLTRAFRRLEPNAKNMFFQTLGVVNVAWLVLLTLVVPGYSRAAFEKHAAALLPGVSPQQVQRLTALLPHGSAVPGALASATPAPRVPTAAPSALPSAATAASAPAEPFAPPAPTSSAIRQAPEALAEAETPAGKVYRERSGSVVVIHTRTAIPKSGVFARLYERLGASYGEGLGSGFVVAEDGLIVTNHHVIDGATALQVVAHDGTHYDDVTVLRDEAKNDLALLSVPAQRLAMASLSQAKDVSVGARAIAIGCPLGFEYTLTEGIVSQLRDLDGTRFLQMQTTVAPGSSGGPLFDERGFVIGVNTATGGAAGLNLAVHFSQVQRLLEGTRAPRALAHFTPGPRLSALETEGEDLNPTARMNIRNSAGLLGPVAVKCAKPLVDDAQVTVKLPALPTSAALAIETNLPSDARDCMSASLSLIGPQIAAIFAQLDKPPSELRLTFADLPREDGATGTLLYRFKR
jgi:serine protease Do